MGKIVFILIIMLSLFCSCCGRLKAFLMSEILFEFLSTSKTKGFLSGAGKEGEHQRAECVLSNNLSSSALANPLKKRKRKKRKKAVYAATTAVALTVLSFVVPTAVDGFSAVTYVAAFCVSAAS